MPTTPTTPRGAAAPLGSLGSLNAPHGEGSLTLVIGPLTLRVRLLALKLALGLVAVVALAAGGVALVRHRSHRAWCRAAGFMPVAQRETSVAAHAAHDADSRSRDVESSAGPHAGWTLATAHFEEVSPGKLRVSMKPLDRRPKP